MRFTDAQVDGFGVWKGLHIESLGDNMTVFYGQNEAGKTTLMQFLRSMMFGFAAERREKYTPPVYGGLAGGTVWVRSPLGHYEIQRHVDPNRHADAVGDLSVVDADKGDLYGSAQLASLLSNIDEPIFNNVFSVGLQEIQELGALNNTQAAEHLYRLTSGMDRVSLIDVLRDLNKRREALWSDDASLNARLNKLQSRKQSLLREIEELRGKSKRWSKIAAQAKEAAVQIADLQAELKRTEREARLVEVAMQVSERWQNRRGLSQQIDAIGKLPDPRDVSVARLDEINQRLAQQQERIEQLTQQRNRVKREAAGLQFQRSIWNQRGRIEALAAHSPWIESLIRQAEQLKAEIAGIEESIVGEVDSVGNQMKIKVKDIQALAGKSFSSLRNAARTLSEQTSRLNRLKEEADKAKFELGQHEQHLGNSLSEHTNSIPETLDETSRHVNRLRRRIELDEKIDKLQLAKADLEREVDEVVTDQVLPVGKLTVIGMVFVGGIVLAGFGLVTTIFKDYFSWADSIETVADTSRDLGFLLILLGAVFGFIAMGLKYHWERIAKDEMEDFRHQMELVRQQLKRARTERDEIDRLLPAGIAQTELELKDAEDRLSRLEGLVPMESRAKSARSKLDDLRRRITAQEREVENHEKRWQASLRSVGLPESLTPTQVKELSQRTGRIAEFNSRIELLKKELVDREREVQQIGQRVLELVHECSLETKTTQPMHVLALLTKELDEQRSVVNERKQYLDDYRQLRTQLEKAKRDLDRLEGSKQKHLAAAGVETEEEYRQIDLKHAQREKLIDRRRQLTEQIAAALGNHWQETDVEPLLDAYGYSGLEKRWEALQGETEQLKNEHQKLVQLRGEYLQEIKALGEDCRLDQARLELNCVEADIKQAQRQWQVISTCLQTLESVREGYESKRQPETLKEASGYLDELTEGHYVRIWTRLVGEQLLVDNHAGETITVDKLSRGTREAVYLSLRLALVSAYARRGAVLPLVLDDVLVNFDAKRARSAAQVLLNFSKLGYQILMFTCHDHVRDMFHDLGAEVLVLPSHKDVVEHQARPERYRAGKEQPQVIPVPAPVVRVVPLEPVAAKPVPYVPRERVSLVTEDFDPDLEFELSALAADENRRRRLRDELVYIGPDRDLEIDLSDDHEWLDDTVTRRTA